MAFIYVLVIRCVCVCVAYKNIISRENSKISLVYFLRMAKKRQVVGLTLRTPHDIFLIQIISILYYL